MDFHARQYDPQIGRFLGIDPLADAYGQQIFSTYSAMGNAPTHMIDPNGESFYDNNTLIAAGKYSNSLPTDDEILSEMLMDQRRAESYNYGGGGGGFGYLGSYRSTLDFVNGAGNSYIFTNYLTGIGLSFSIIGSQIRPNGTFYKIRIDGFSSSSQNSANWEEGINVNWNYGKIYELFVPFSQKSAGQQQNGGNTVWQNFVGGLGNAGMPLDAISGSAEAYGSWTQSLSQSRNGWRSGYIAPVSRWTTFGKAVGNTNTAIGVGLLLNDAYDVSRGKMSGARFSYHLTAFGTSVYVGAQLGGPYGAVAGIGFAVVELGYDHVIEPHVVAPAARAYNIGLTSFLNQVKASIMRGY